MTQPGAIRWCAVGKNFCVFAVLLALIQRVLQISFGRRIDHGGGA